MFKGSESEKARKRQMVLVELSDVGMQSVKGISMSLAQIICGTLTQTIS